MEPGRPWLRRLIALAAIGLATAPAAAAEEPSGPGPFLVVLGIAQDGGIPQTGTVGAPGWSEPDARRRVVSLGLVDPRTGSRWMFEATPDFPEQLAVLQRLAGGEKRVPDGVFLTHAHIGHYTGLMFLGHESLGARGVPVYAMPRMVGFLTGNGPWDQLVRYGNIALEELASGRAVPLAHDLRATPLLVPHRQEYSEVVAFRIDGPGRSVLFVPDIDSWKAWDEVGTRLEDLLATVDVAYLDGTFHDRHEIPGRDMSGFPHPTIRESLERLGSLPLAERMKVRFIHLNHTNPVWRRDSAERAAVEAAGFHVAEEGEIVELTTGAEAPDR